MCICECMCVCVCGVCVVCGGVRACVRACVCVVCMSACVRRWVHVIHLTGPGPYTGTFTLMNNQNN